VSERAGGRAGGGEDGGKGAESALKLVVKADRALLRARRPCSPPTRVYIPFMPDDRERERERVRGGRERKTEISVSPSLSLLLFRPLPIYLNARAARGHADTRVPPISLAA